MGRNALVWLLCAALLLVPALASEGDYDAEILSRNRAMAETWVNWRPTQLPEAKLFLPTAAEAAAQATSDYERARAVHDWICANLYFDRDALAAGTYHHLEAAEVLRYRFSVCEGISNLAQALLLTLDIPCRKVWGVAIPVGDTWTQETAAQEKTNHTWLEVYASGRWFPMDCTMDLTSYYSGGIFTVGAGSSTFFDPDEALFARTHKILRRAMDLPQDVPSPWAYDELVDGVRRGLFPLSLLADYRAAITEAELRGLWGLEGGGGEHVTRIDAARLLAEVAAPLPQPSVAVMPFTDAVQLPLVEQSLLSALQAAELLRGTASGILAPDADLTRQEALIIWMRCAEREE